MKIAQIAPLFESVPPQAYGGTERVVSYLTEALVEAGHDVTLFASGDSVTTADLMAVCERSLRTDPHRPDWTAWHMVMLDEVFRRAGEFDVMHFHIDALHYPLARRCPGTACLTTLHGRLDLPALAPLHRHFAGHPLVSISDHQRRALPTATFVGTVHHGLPPGLYDFNPRPQDYFAFVGRISPEKRLDRAIEIAIACDTPLKVAAKIDDADREYFHREIEHLLAHPLVEFLGEVGDDRKNLLLGGARALLFPIDWPEPFGLVLIEAMACGTPVVAYGHGSVPELVEDGVSGVIVHDQAQAIEAARHIARIDRQGCRQAFEDRFTSATMAQRYVDLYGQLRAAIAPPLRLPRGAAGRLGVNGASAAAQTAFPAAEAEAPR
ncbi:glycosyltransferase family 4 protein [Ramlibacter tataouinensis]|uniref:glycosyltransferase family 4 protein n=1 Tax=Ramlibacter tataouinensis TaxID=94132 RepID=UPI0022F407B1|nr:glycosyltransferase family 4 protein [Ramlibacter tataouinensis]WBY01130.1 glycosyltransferase family 4 protein [Ramlibacter tataouinensis]